MSPEDIRTKLIEEIPDANIELKDLTGGGDHWHLDIQSSLFIGKTLINQHQMIYKYQKI